MRNLTCPSSRTLAIAVTVAAALTAPPASAQERQAPAAELAGGALLFADDGIVTEGFVGGTVRFYVSPRLSVGPEVAFASGENHDHLMVTGNVTFDFIAPVNRDPPRLTPFVVAGAGLFRTNESFPGIGDFTHNEGAFTAGGGVRALVSPMVIAGAEARVGWETHIRLNGFIGVRFGR